MTKESVWHLRVSEHLNQLAEEEARQRGMNMSEFIRYAVSVFLDHLDDSKPQDNERVPQ